MARASSAGMVSRASDTSSSNRPRVISTPPVCWLPEGDLDPPGRRLRGRRRRDGGGLRSAVAGGLAVGGLAVRRLAVGGWLLAVLRGRSLLVAVGRRLLAVLRRLVA